MSLNLCSMAGCVTGLLFFFFFQAEDGIRDHCVTGVQTCALPIYLVQGMIWKSSRSIQEPMFRLALAWKKSRKLREASALSDWRKFSAPGAPANSRSEERRVGKEWKSRWAPEH